MPENKRKDFGLKEIVEVMAAGKALLDLQEIKKQQTIQANESKKQTEIAENMYKDGESERRARKTREANEASERLHEQWRIEAEEKKQQEECEKEDEAKRIRFLNYATEFGLSPYCGDILSVYHYKKDRKDRLEKIAKKNYENVQTESLEVNMAIASRALKKLVDEEQFDFLLMGSDEDSRAERIISTSVANELRVGVVESDFKTTLIKYLLDGEDFTSSFISAQNASWKQKAVEKDLIKQRITEYRQRLSANKEKHKEEINTLETELNKMLTDHKLGNAFFVLSTPLSISLLVFMWKKFSLDDLLLLRNMGDFFLAKVLISIPALIGVFGIFGVTRIKHEEVKTRKEKLENIKNELIELQQIDNDIPKELEAQFIDYIYYLDDTALIEEGFGYSVVREFQKKITVEDKKAA